MKQYKLTDEEIIRIAHLTAERATLSTPGSDSKRFVTNYMEYYNRARNELESYNQSVSNSEH